MSDDGGSPPPVCSEEDPGHPDAVQAATEDGCGPLLHPAGLHRDGQLHTSTESTTTAQEVRPPTPASHPHPPPHPETDGQTQTDARTDEKTDGQMDGQESDTRTQR